VSRGRVLNLAGRWARPTCGRGAAGQGLRSAFPADAAPVALGRARPRQSPSRVYTRRRWQRTSHRERRNSTIGLRNASPSTRSSEYGCENSGCQGIFDVPFGADALVEHVVPESDVTRILLVVDFGSISGTHIERSTEGVRPYQVREGRLLFWPQQSLELYRQE